MEYVSKKTLFDIMATHYPWANPREESALFKIKRDLEKASPWINVDEALPENHTNVIIARRISGEWIVEQGMRLTDGQWKVYGTRCRTVEYWMPLPDAPGGDGDA